MVFRFLIEPSRLHSPQYAILDRGGIVPVDDEYVSIGISEGWLEYNGYTYDVYSELVYLYRLC